MSCVALVAPQAPQNGEDAALSRAGEELYEAIFKHYTKKQWDKYPEELDASVLLRIPVRTNTDDRYFSDPHQALPKDGYTRIFENMYLNNPKASEMRFPSQPCLPNRCHHSRTRMEDGASTHHSFLLSRSPGCSCCRPHAARVPLLPSPSATPPQITIRLATDFFEVKDNLPKHSLLVFTGPIDAYYARLGQSPSSYSCKRR